MTETVTEETSNSQTAASLSLTDLKLCVQIIDLCSQRGAFKPDEFQAVGQIHSKLTAFLASSVPTPATDDTAETTKE